MESFDLIPISCIINGKFLALHGGISPELRTVNIILEYHHFINIFQLEDINKIDRIKEPPRQGIFW